MKKRIKEVEIKYIYLSNIYTNIITVSGSDNNALVGGRYYDDEEEEW